jgi:hypothetical protein
MAAGAGGIFLAVGGALLTGTLVEGARFSSLELQLEIPKAANNDSTTTVKAIRAGVHNRFPVSDFLFNCISYFPETNTSAGYEGYHPRRLLTKLSRRECRLLPQNAAQLPTLRYLPKRND